MNNAASQYQTNAVNTAVPGGLTLMLYNGAIKFINQARTAIAGQNWELANQFNMRVQDIISELMITLDRSYPISEQLLSLYDYLNYRMIEANVKKDVEILNEVQDFFVQFRDTWKQAMILAKKH